MKIPQSELNSPGVLCKAKRGDYQVTRNDAKDKFTLWKIVDDGVEKILSDSNINKVYAAIPWK